MELIIYFQGIWQLAIQGETQGIWFWAAFYAFIVCLYSLIFQIRTRYWPFARGEITEFGVEKFGATDLVKSNQDYISKALYKYNVSGVAYDGTRISPWIFVASHNARFILEKQMSSIQRLPDGKIKVFYNPNNPKKGFLIIAGKMGICITLSICVLPLISFYYKYHA
jgi:hypothetical protein